MPPIGDVAAHFPAFALGATTGATAMRVKKGQLEDLAFVCVDIGKDMSRRVRPTRPVNGAITDPTAGAGSGFRRPAEMCGRNGAYWSYREMLRTLSSDRFR